jgi:hypothetical protein
MSTNKNATLRYHVLDRCFSHFSKKYYIEDLIEACNQALNEYSGIENGVKKRQIFDDILFMESEHGWLIPLNRIREGKRVYYRYEDRSFSIKNKGLNADEANLIKETFIIMSRFKGMPHFEWIEEMQVRLEDLFKFNKSKNPIVSFEQNSYLKGISNFSNLFNAILNQQLIRINYKSFKTNKIIEEILHPWYLKEYNNRWFLFGYIEKYDSISNFPVDRIENIFISEGKYIKNEEIDFDEYFEDVVGATVDKNEKIEKILINISSNLWNYIETKPIHDSQKRIFIGDEFVQIQLKLKINHELISLLFSYLDQIEIIEPQILRERFYNISKCIYEKYN